MSELSEKILNVSTVYLGPAAKTFLERQTKMHMGGLAFENLEKPNLPDLCKWIKISASLILDKGRAEEFANIVQQLA
jgi:hypothetical protein